MTGNDKLDHLAKPLLMARGLLQQLRAARYGQATYLSCVRPLVSPASPEIPLQKRRYATLLEGWLCCTHPRLMRLVRGHAKAK